MVLKHFQIQKDYLRIEKCYSVQIASFFPVHYDFHENRFSFLMRAFADYKALSYFTSTNFKAKDW